MRVLAYLSVLPALARAQTCPANTTCKLTFSDEFDGTELDLSKWEPQLGRGCELPSGCGWGNNELQSYQAANAEVSDGTLKIWARRENVPGALYTSARLRTKGKFSQTFGIFEAKIRLPSFDGAWPAFWMMPENDTYGGWAASGEIDIMEAKNDCGVAQNVLHFGGSWPNQRNSDQCVQPCLTAIEPGWHVHKLVWRSRAIKWYIDGVLACTRKQWWSDNAPGDEDAPFDKPFHFILNVALGGGYPGRAPDAAALPQAMEVDWVRAYKFK